MKIFAKSLAAKHSSGCITGLKSKFTVVLGSQWGDEVKGKLVEFLPKVLMFV